MRNRRLPHLIALGLCFATLAPIAAHAGDHDRFFQPQYFLYVNTAQELRDHFNLHIQRVVALGLALYDEKREIFGKVPRELVAEFLKLHDLAKIDDSAEFRRKYWVIPTSERSYIDRLLVLYGTDRRAVPREVLALIAEIRDTLNRADDNVAMEFFARRGLLDSEGNLKEAAELLKRIERIADVLDRNTDPVAAEEFALPSREQDRPKMDDFLKEPDLGFAKSLKDRYVRIVQDLTYLGHYGYGCDLYLL